MSEESVLPFASLLNLEGLIRRDRTWKNAPWKRGSFGDMTRRSFLKLSGSVPMMPAAVAAVGAHLGSFELRHEGGVARFLVDGVERWRIDPAQFAGSPKLNVARRFTSVQLALTGARFPGTALSAALRCMCSRTTAGWLMDLEFADLSWSARVSLVAWLLDSVGAESSIRLPDIATAACGSQFGVEGSAHAVFRPSWTFEIAGRAWFSGPLGSSRASSLTIAIPPRDGESLLLSQATPRTRVTMAKGTDAWKPAPPPVPKGTTLTGFEDAVDLLDAELAESHRDTFAAVRWSARNEHPALLARRQVPLALSDAMHVIVAKQGKIEERLFIADLASPTTIPTTAFQLRVVNDPEQKTITVHEVNGERTAESAAPVVHSVIASIEGASSFAVPPPERVALDLTENYDAANGCWGLADCDGGTDVEVCAESICFGVLRPEDLLMLCVELRNVRVRKPFLGTPYIQACGGATPSLILHFPPQHIGEQAFYEALCPEQSEDPCDPPVGALIAGWSRLAFTLPATGRTPFTLEALLDWSGLTPSLVPQTRKRDQIAKPAGDQTDLELPYRLHLSPETEERWRHSARPRVDGERTELWHTRLVRPPVVEGDPRPRVRAVWSPDFLRQMGCEPLPGDCPFRMSLAPVDRHRLVRVMHDQGIDAAPAAANLLLLSSLGAWTDIEGFWPITREHQNRPVPLEKWQHVMTMGRDQKVVVETRGFLLPFGHPATLVKETERKIQILYSREDGGRLPVPVAYLRQRKYIRIKQPVMPYANWDMAFRTVTFLERVSPPLDDPLNDGIPRSNANAHWSEKAFWPKVAGRPYDFLLEGTDYAGAKLRFRAPVIFVEAPGDDRPGEGCEQPKCEKYDGPCVSKPDQIVPLSPFEDPVADAVRHYNSDGAKLLRRRPLQGQPLSIAMSRRKGDTEIEATVVEFHACLVKDSPKPGTEPCAACAREADFPPEIFPHPPFFASSPKVKGAVPSLERILPDNGGDAWWIVQNPNCFTDGTEVFAALSLVLGEAQFPSAIDTLAKASDALAQDARLQEAGATAAGIVSEQGRFFWRQDVSTLDAAFTRLENETTYRYFHESGSRPPAAPFQTSADKSGGALAPTPSITHLSREVGPIGLSPGVLHPATTAITNTFDLAANAAASKPFNPADFFSADATILGKVRLIDILKDVLGVGDVPGVLSTLVDFADGPNELRQSIDWKTRELRRFSLGGFFEFIPLADAELEIHGSFFAYLPPIAPPTFSMAGTVKNVSIAINVGVGGVGVEFHEVSYSAGSDGSSKFDVNLGDIRFTGALAVVQQLAEKLKSLQQGSVAGLEYELKPDGLMVRTPPLNLPTIPLGAFTLANLNIGSWLKLPFRAQPVEIGAFFSRPEAPFQVTVGIFGGQGYFMIAIDADQKGIRYLAACVEFGALKELSFGPAHGKVYVLGGVYYGITVSGGQKVTVFRAYVRAGGEVDVLGLISMCIDVYIGLEARDDGMQSSLYGEATLTVSFKIGFFEKSVTLRRTEKFAGSQTGGGGGRAMLDFLPPPMISAGGSVSASRADKAPDLESWMPKRQFRTYWNAFARAKTGGRE